VVRALLTANVKVATVLGSIPASSDTVESEGAADEAVLNTVHRRKKNTLFDFHKRSPLHWSLTSYIVQYAFANCRRVSQTGK
jgi:hypothetical protein